MGSFFTNVHVRVPDGVTAGALADRLRTVVEQQLVDEGFQIVDGPGDREIVIVPAGRWLAFFDPRTEDQDDRVEVWAKDLSKALETEAFSVLVHDSDVLALSLFAGGTVRDRYDSNPGFSGKQPSRITPAARADRWANIVAPGHATAELAAAFAWKHIMAEAALTQFAPAIGADVALLATGYRYLTRAGDVPAAAVRIHARFTKRPAWENRTTGLPRLISQWARHGMEPPHVEPLRVLLGQPLHGHAIAMNIGGAAQGLRIAITASSECIELERVEVVITKPGRDKLDRSPATLMREDGRYVAELPEVMLQPGFAGAPHDLVDAPMDAMLAAQHAGQVHVNLIGSTRHAGAATLAIELAPLANPKGAHVEHVAVEVSVPRGIPLRASGELHPHELDRLVNDTHTYLLVLLDAPADEVKAQAIELLATVRGQWPNTGPWYAFASDERHGRSDELKPKGTTAWRTLEQAIRATKAQVSATHAPRPSYDTTEASGFEVNLCEELGAIGIWIANARVDQPAVESALIAGVDAIAKTGTLVQGVLAHWQIDSGSVTTPYEATVGLHGDFMASRGWATRWLRGIGRGQLWLGHALRARLDAAPSSSVELGAAIRVPVTDVAATEAALATLLPTDDDGHAYQRARRDDA